MEYVFILFMHAQNGGLVEVPHYPAMDAAQCNLAMEHSSTHQMGTKGLHFTCVPVPREDRKPNQRVMLQ